VVDVMVVSAMESFARSSHRVAASAVPAHMQAVVANKVTVTRRRIALLLPGYPATHNQRFTSLSLTSI
jgi:hypothetical protein